MSESPWWGQPYPAINLNHLARRAEEVLDRIQRAGVVLPAGNRISRAIRAIDLLNDDFRAGRFPSESDLIQQRLILEHQRLLIDALVVVFARDERRTGPRALREQHLRALLEGADLPSSNVADRARDFQFEAVVGASLVLSGLDVEMAEPDFRVGFYGTTIGVAVKRLSSTKPGKLYDRMREADGQIRASATSGFIAVNLDSWVNEPELADSPDSFGLRFEADVREAYRQLSKLADRPSLLGMIISRTTQGWSFRSSPPEPWYQTGWQILAFADDENEHERVMAFWGPASARLQSARAEISRLLTRSDSSPPAT